MNLKTVKLGSLVWLKAQEDSKEKNKEITLVDPVAIDPDKGKISVFSPLGKALIGRKEGDKLGVKISPNLRAFYEIKRVL